MPTGLSGRLLLTIPGCHVECAGNEYHGTLALAYVAVAPTGQLALRVSDFETLLAPTQPIVRQRALGIYTVPGTPTPATLCVPLTAPNALARVVLDAFGVLLARFCILHEAEGDPPDDREAYDLQMDGPVPDEPFGSPAAQTKPPVRDETIALASAPAPAGPHVRALLPEETAALLRSAHALSRGIVLTTTTLAAGMALASSAFVARTAPNTSPLVFSAETRRNIEGAHAFSGAALSASAHTTELILHVVDQTAECVAPGPRPPPPAAPPTGVAALAPSADLVLAALAQSGEHLLVEGTRALAGGLGHRYGADVARVIQLGSETARNLSAVCSDARSVGRHALLLRVGQRVVSARVSALFDTNADAPPAV